MYPGISPADPPRSGPHFLSLSPPPPFSLQILLSNSHLPPPIHTPHSTKHTLRPPTMKSLDSPLEALVFFDSTTLGFFVNNIWTWVAVITAAVSFWRLRSTGSFPIKSDSPPPTHVSSTSTTTTTVGLSPSPTTLSSSPPSPAVDSAASVSSTGSGACGSSNEDHGLTKGKFAVVYYGEEEVEDREIEDGVVEGEWEEERRGSGGGMVVRRWERDQECEVVNMMMKKVRMGDMGWYKYQDLKVLDGSVVRLWEKERERGISSFTGGDIPPPPPVSWHPQLQ
ncbi:hypothetical protein Ancab_017859 [Ancistrocladus abbreviatus]